MNINVIGLMGPAGCGKTTVANILVGRYGYVRIRVADTIKRMLLVMGLTPEQVDGDEKEVPCDLLGGKTPRHAMQTLGFEWGRTHIDRGIWVRATEALVRRVVEEGHNVVIDDIRFPEESHMVRRMNGSLYRILRSASETKVMHASELEWRDIPVDGIICNEFDTDHLHQQVSQIFNITLDEQNWTPHNEQ